ncbi:MAG: aminotransferase class I/II-fold pyridoxal phosphate-dependent enzyme [bacterium]|nr:aminotransferase class I/II-fold pyridoxal phosphate-dependent enzyme [bacterium]
MSLSSLIKKKTNKTLFTTPSHSGRLCLYHKFLQWYKSDISETDTYNPQVALIEAEKKAALIYGTKYTKFLTNGSTSGVIGAILASNVKKILIWDKAHPCHKNGAELAGCEIIEYQMPFDHNLGVYRQLTDNDIKNIIEKYMPDGIIITSPTYEGFAIDIKAISNICKKKSVKLIVDEAHGALYPFSDLLPTSAVKYADYTIQSLHKTAGGINPTAIIHSNDNDPTKYLAKFNTTSPSYPMLATIEENINYLNSTKGEKAIANLINNIQELCIPKLNDDVTKILIMKDGMSGYELSKLLYNKFGIEDERANEKSVMLLCGLGTNLNKLTRLKKALKKMGF